MISYLASWFGNPRPVVPVIRMNGLIAANSSAGGIKRGLNLASLATPINNAFTMRNVRAVALLINSPGGSAVQSAQIYQRIRDLSHKHDIPVLSFVEDVAASGAYWLACAGDEIIVNPASVVGSIGVVSSGFGFDKAIEKLGIERRSYTAGTRKAMLDPFKPENTEDIEHLKTLLAEIHEQFVSAVKKRRGDRLKSVDDDLFNGAFWTGKTALELGLVDHLGDLRGVLEERFGENVDIRVLQIKRSLWGMGKAGGVMSHFAENVAVTTLDAVEDRMTRSRFGL